VNDDEIRQSARGMALSWLGEWALMMRSDQPPDTQGLDAHSRIVDRHIDELLTIRAGLAESWGWPEPPQPFPFQERADEAADLDLEPPPSAATIASVMAIVDAPYRPGLDARFDEDEL
jgi:hypothetical protein